jgi:hypothetical protein
MEEEPKKSSKWFIIAGIILVILLLVVAGIFYWYIFLRSPSAVETAVQQAAVSVPESSKSTFVNDVSGVQTITSEQTKPSVGESKSENYTIKEITFGGYEVDMSGEAKSTPLLISNVKGETVVSTDGKQTRLLFSWKTNKLATSTVTYARNDGPIKNTLNEPGPGFSHALILNFEPATRYTYSITAKDRWGNTASSDKFTTFTSTKSNNVVDLIIQQFRQMFSWLVSAR